jgi:protein transport protein SEC24
MNVVFCGMCVCKLFSLNHSLLILSFILAGISRFSGGCIYHFPLFRASDTVLSDSFERSFRRYLTRKIGFEAVMRIRCSRYGSKYIEI